MCGVKKEHEHCTDCLEISRRRILVFRKNDVSSSSALAEAEEIIFLIINFVS